MSWFTSTHNNDSPVFSCATFVSLTGATFSTPTAAKESLIVIFWCLAMIHGLTADNATASLDSFVVLVLLTCAQDADQVQYKQPILY